MMSAAEVLAVTGALALAALLGVSDAPNAIAALVSGRTRSYHTVVGWSLVWHLLGGLLASTVVARTTVELVRVPPQLLTPVLGAGCWSAVIFTWWTTRLGFPTSASVGLVGGLAGAGLAGHGWHGVTWGGFEGFRLVGVLGVLAGILLAPLVAGTVAFAIDRFMRPISLRLRRGAARPIRAGVWLASAAVAFADGTNDGQKAMGVLAASVSGAVVLRPGGGERDCMADTGLVRSARGCFQRSRRSRGRDHGGPPAVAFDDARRPRVPVLCGGDHLPVGIAGPAALDVDGRDLCQGRCRSLPAAAPPAS